MRILIVEDEKRLAEALAQILKNEGYEVDQTGDGDSGLDYALSGIYDVIVLDIMLPKKNGFEVVKSLRQNKIAVPVLMLTARDETADKVTGLDCGADDYMTKPFIADELLARIRALTRRQGEVILEELTFEDISLNLSAHSLHCGFKSVHLPHKEFEILKLLLAAPGAIVSKESLITKVWGYNSEAEDNNVKVYISFLRKKLFFVRSAVTIGTVRKAGYRLEKADA